MKVLLSDEQIIGEVFDFGNSAVHENGEVPQKIEYYQMICKAQLKAVIEYLWQHCTNPRHYSNNLIPIYPRTRFLCPECWAALKKEVGC